MYILNVLLIVLMVLNKWIRNKETEGLNGQLQVFGKREKAAELLKELLRRYLCIAFGHTYVRMSEHLYLWVKAVQASSMRACSQMDERSLSYTKLPELKRSSIMQKTAERSNRHTSKNNSVTRICTIVTCH